MASGGDSWADQWGYKDDAPDEKKKGGSGGGTSSYKQKFEEGLGKTKGAASSGVKKVKEGTAVGINWIKDKYQKTTQRGK